MKFTRSKDGIDRVTLHAEIRLDADQLKVARSMVANSYEGDSLKAMMDRFLSDRFWQMVQAHEEDATRRIHA